MNTAASIVRTLLEDEYDYKSDAISTEHRRVADQRLGLNPNVHHDFDHDSIKDISFGFAISTSPQQMVEDAAAELGLELNDQSWEQINKDIERIENNCIALLKHHGLRLSPEGHGSDDALVGTAWVKPGGPGWKWIKEWENDTEPLSTTSGTLTSVEGAEKLFDGVSEMGQRVLDISVGFFDLDALQNFKEGLPNED